MSATGNKPSLMPVNGMTVNLLGGGYVGRVLEKEVELMVADTIDRGADGKPRRVGLTLFFTLAGRDEAGNPEVKIEAKVNHKAPDHVPYLTVAKWDKGAGGLMFNPHSPGNPNQLTIDDVDGD